MDALTRLIHLLGLAAYLGSTLDLVLVFLPALEAEPDPVRRRRVLARGLRAYNLLSVGALGVLVLSGASGLTDLKGRLLADYTRLLWPLVVKLALAFALILVGTYLAFGSCAPSWAGFPSTRRRSARSSAACAGRPGWRSCWRRGPLGRGCGFRSERGG